MTESKVTIIVPTYNSAVFLQETLESALSQEDVSAEVVVVDDGSTDDTERVLARFDNRIRLVKQRNAGPASARNHGARVATGEWLAFLDADDLWLSDKLKRQLAVVDEDTVFAYSDRRNFGNADCIHEIQSDGQTLHEGRIFQRLLLEGNFVTLSSVLMRREVFEQLGGFDESPQLVGVEDWDLWLRACELGTVRCVHEPLVKYRWHAGGISRRLDQMRAGQLAVIARAQRCGQASVQSPFLWRRARSRAMEIVASYAALDGRWFKAIQWYGEALWNWPFRFASYKAIVKCLLRRA